MPYASGACLLVLFVLYCPTGTPLYCCTAADVDVSEQFLDPALYPPWAVDPLAVSTHPGRFARCDKAAALCSNDQSVVAPMRRMQVRRRTGPSGGGGRPMTDPPQVAWGPT